VWAVVKAAEVVGSYIDTIDPFEMLGEPNARNVGGILTPLSQIVIDHFPNAASFSKWAEVLFALPVNSPKFVKTPYYQLTADEPSYDPAPAVTLALTTLPGIAKEPQYTGKFHYYTAADLASSQAFNINVMLSGLLNTFCSRLSAGSVHSFTDLMCTLIYVTRDTLTSGNVVHRYPFRLATNVGTAQLDYRSYDQLRYAEHLSTSVGCSALCTVNLSQLLSDIGAGILRKFGYRYKVPGSQTPASKATWLAMELSSASGSLEDATSVPLPINMTPVSTYEYAMLATPSALATDYRPLTGVGSYVSFGISDGPATGVPNAINVGGGSPGNASTFVASPYSEPTLFGSDVSLGVEDVEDELTVDACELVYDTQ